MDATTDKKTTTNGTKTEAKRLATCPRGDSEELRIELAEYEGKPYISLRVWFEASEGGKWLPSKKGVSVRIRELPDVIKALCDPTIPKPNPSNGQRHAKPKPPGQLEQDGGVF